MGPLIAIAGSVADKRKDELKLGDPATARKAASEIGRELATAGCRILVYSTEPEFIESDVLSGYVGSNKATPRSIQVRYPLSRPQPLAPEYAARDALFEWLPTQSSEWEVAFYRSVEEIDGMLLVGGGYSTLVGGLVAMGQHVPIVALAAFGGAASKVWESLLRSMVSPRGKRSRLWRGRSGRRNLGSSALISCLLSVSGKQRSLKGIDSKNCAGAEPFRDRRYSRCFSFQSRSAPSPWPGRKRNGLATEVCSGFFSSLPYWVGCPAPPYDWYSIGDKGARPTARSRRGLPPRSALWRAACRGCCSSQLSCLRCRLIPVISFPNFKKHKRAASFLCAGDRVHRGSNAGRCV